MNGILNLCKKVSKIVQIVYIFVYFSYNILYFEINSTLLFIFALSFCIIVVVVVEIY